MLTRRAEQVGALGGVEAAPDAVGLADVEGVAQALGDDGAATAERLRGGFAGAAAWAALGLGGEERLGVDLAAGAEVLPFVRLLDRNRES